MAAKSIRACTRMCYTSLALSFLVFGITADAAKAKGVSPSVSLTSAALQTAPGPTKPKPIDPPPPPPPPAPPPPGAPSGPPHAPIVEWEKRQNAEERLRSYGPDILGDGIDPHTGSISFTHMDVSLPGNSTLEVAVRRKRSQGYFYHEDEDVEFGDWQIDAPRIHVITGASSPWTGNRCSNSYATSFPTEFISNGGGGGVIAFTAGQYAEGVKMASLGGGAHSVLENKQGAHWPSAATHVTTDGWYLTCGSASDGGQGFIAHAPNGDTYTFDKVITRDARKIGTTGQPVLNRMRNILAATEVTDVHGNWVRFDYDSLDRLTKIHANDGREITLSYSGSSELIASVTANGRTWSYSYGTSTYSPRYELGELWQGDTSVLRTVTQPDSKAWSFSIDNISASPGRGDFCFQNGQSISLTHPYGVQGTFALGETKHRQSYNLLAQVSDLCPYDGATPPNGPTVPVYDLTRFKTMSVLSKQLSGPNLTTAVWTYTYEQDTSNAGTSGGDRTNWTIVDDPTGTRVTYYHFWPAEEVGHKFGNKLDRKTTADVSAPSTILETQEFDYYDESLVGTTFEKYGPSPASIWQPLRTIESKLTRESETYETDSEYDHNFASSNYSHGFPTKVTQSSTVMGTSPARVTETEYEHNTTKWILGLPTEIKRNGKIFDEYDYDTNGRRLWNDRFGARWATLTYHTSGSQAGLVATYKDSLNGITSLNNYKRGISQSLTRPDTVTLTRVVDDNGWVTSQTNGRGYTTGFTHNNIGWLTLIDRTAPFDDTTIVYSGQGTSNFFQKATRGPTETVNWYDAMLRPWRTRTRAASAGGTTSHVTMSYDAIGRETFTSFPSALYTPTEGTDTTYDALGRVISVKENVSPFAETTTNYLSQNRTQLIDPTLASTTTKARGFGSPDDGEPIEVIDAMGGVTSMTYDVYGNITQLSQSGTQNGYTASVTREFWYDARNRLCRHRAPEFGDELFSYDAHDRKEYSERGAATGTGCATPAPANRTAYTYDALDRLTFVDFPSGTDDITNYHDNNSNLTRTDRGITRWDYQYNKLDKIKNEKLTVDGNVYEFIFNYNVAGYLQQRTSVNTGLVVDYVPNGLGQPTKIGVGSTDYVSGITYHPNGAVAGGTYANGQIFTQLLNTRQLTSRLESVKPAGDTALLLTYGYDARGKVTAINDYAVSGYNRTFDYDAKGRLTSATGAWGTGSYKYDALDNMREKKLGSRTVTLNYANNRVNDVIDTSNPFRAFLYDSRGNTYNDGKHNFIYDHANQPVYVSGPGVSQDYIYDGNRKRAKYVRSSATTIYYAYSKVTGKPILRHNTNNGNKFDFVDVGPFDIWFKNGAFMRNSHEDHLGSRVSQTGASGTVLTNSRFHLTPFGETHEGGNTNAQLFTGHMRDAETGLHYMQARHYDPVIGRFFQTDPIGYEDQLNLYAYVHNDPVNSFDPNGEAGQLVAGGAAGCALTGPACPAGAIAGVAIAAAVTIVAAVVAHEVLKEEEDGSSTSSNDTETEAEIGLGPNYGTTEGTVTTGVEETTDGLTEGRGEEPSGEEPNTDEQDQRFRDHEGRENMAGEVQKTMEEIAQPDPPDEMPN